MNTNAPLAERSPGPVASGSSPEANEVLLEPHTGWRPVNFGEIWQHRDLLWHLTRKNILARYVQSVLGLGWAIVQPITTMVVFAVVFGRVAKIPVPGDVPYPLFVFCGIVPWTFFSAGVSSTSASLVSNAAILGKVYFPRMILPISELATKFVDLLITLVVLGVLMAAYGFIPRPEAVVMVPLATLVAATAALGMGMWLSVLALQYRDVAYGLSFFVQILMYLSPVIYSASSIVNSLGLNRTLIWGLNPMVGVISTYRSAILGMQEPYAPMLLAEGALVAVALLITGAFYFRRSERLFADVS